MNRHRTPRWRGLLTTALATTLGAPFLGALPAVAAEPVQPTTLQSKADSALLKDFTRHDKVSFWVQLASQADTSAARKAPTKTGQGRAVLKAKTAYAKSSQQGLTALLKQADASYTSYWISNTVKVTGSKALAAKIAARPDVASIEADDTVPLPPTANGTNEAKVGGIEWNVDRINAPKVWNEYGVRGEGVVIGSIDTGVDFQHPALAAGYRGLKADGTYDHAYNWFDATRTCGTTQPCDDQGHGTHTMGTMTGEDGTTNTIGVAPGARWIAAKACTTENCPREALLSAGQWMLAPTDADGQNPRPDLAPDVINNSWGADSLDTWYQAMVQSWRDAGIFPAFSNGNAGPYCDTAGSPGAYTNTYASGAFDSNNKIASFSSRGPGVDGTVKPNIAAPGVNVRSAVPGGGYAAKSGTSMASPHTAATVALLWSAAPGLRGDVPATEAVLNKSAADVDDTTCGGTTAFNNVYGEGRLDAYAAVNAAPRDHIGALTGTVTIGGERAADVEVSVAGPTHATLTTKKDGTYAFPRLVSGDYTATVTKFGYVTDTATLTVTDGGSATHDAALATAPTGTVTGTVRSDSGTEADVAIKVQGTPVRASSAANGTYELTLPVGSYQLSLTPLNHCAATIGIALDVATGTAAKDVALATRSDAFGTTCQQVSAEFPTGETKLDLLQPSAAYSAVTAPFPIALYGHTYDKGWITRDGQVIFGYLWLADNTQLPNKSPANGALSPFWDQLAMDDSSGIYTAVRGTAPHREYVVEWRDMLIARDPSERIGFAAVIGEDGTYTFHYKGIDPSAKGFEQATGATIGAENHDGTDALQYSFNQLSVRDGMAIRFRPEGHAVVSGTVTDANDGKPVAGATVTVARGGTSVGTATTRADGAYLTQVPVTAAADHKVTVTAPHYATATRTAELGNLSALRTESALTTGAVRADNGSGWQLVVPAGEQRRRTLTLTNGGSSAAYTVAEKSGASWLKIAPASGTLGAGAQQQVTLTFDTAAAKPGTVYSGTLVVTSESARTPTFSLPVKLVVPAYQKGVDVGADTASVDALGDTWTQDRPYAEGAFGYVGDTTALTYTRKDIAGAVSSQEQQLLRSGREGVSEYRFGAVPNGVYQVELGFAEPAGVKPGQRVFDVTAEGVEKVADVDVRLESGAARTALSRTFTVKVTDGRLEVGFKAVTGTTLVNSIRVTQRPDLTS
ncbi:S8 family serine peptidase [Streptomyces sp. P01-B04]|uniref:S8 family serine peptidase n=1 Tax=Streptomyces poriferorum TaxID=2798799 RepID=UPI001C5E5FE8|nr:S8 family serine peptidase [Streptomyces poriferorum]MBW5248309.1 S8 family serine peptidase [Streptomyces poriferorum]MBW5255297.1 S8 family serine peptidase [Streptomyces poriferorum]